MTVPSRFRLNVQADGTVLAAEFPHLPNHGIYVFTADGVVIRVGECTSGERLRKGFRDPLRHVRRNKERKNYIAYHWRDSYGGRIIDVDYFELRDQRFADNHFRRALEAEVTFQFRVANGMWPKEMSEIHFLERYRTDRLLVDTCKAILQFYKVPFDAAV